MGAPQQPQDENEIKKQQQEIQPDEATTENTKPDTEVDEAETPTPLAVEPEDQHLQSAESDTENDAAATKEKLVEPAASEAAVQDATQTEPDAAAAPVPIVSEKPKRHWFRPENILLPVLRRKLGTHARLAGVCTIVVIVLAGSCAGYWGLIASRQQSPLPVGSFKTAVKPFKLVSTEPGNNATNVNTASHITLNFSQPVNAAKLTNNMFITPQIAGTFQQGSNTDQIVFVPKLAFAQGVKYSVMINGTLQSAGGTQLGVPIAYGFTTSIPGDSVAFSDHTGLIDEVTSLPSGGKESYTLQFGNQVSPTVTVTLYKGNVDALLSSLVYTSSTTSGYLQQQFSDPSVSTSGLTKVLATPNIKDQSSYDVQQPDGLYVAVATDSAGKEVGFVWVDVSNFGVMLRQDDQKTVLDAQSFSSGQDVSANTTFYNLKGGVNSLGQKTVTGLTTVNMGYNQGLDMAVATNNGETAVIPVNVLDSGGDIRVDQNLSTAQTVYAVTDKPSYNAGDTVDFSGYLRLDNDAQYVNPGTGKVKLYVSAYKGDTAPRTTLTATVDANGMFSGSFKTNSSWLSSGDAFDQFQLYASSVSGNPSNDSSVASFTVAGSTNQANTINVSFTKASYLPSDKITANISAVGSNGQPLANTSVQVHVFSEDYYENDLADNQQNFGYVGTALAGSPVTVKLDANGQATYTVNASSLPSDGNSQQVTVQANLPNQTGVGAAGGDSAIVHQGDGSITFGPTRRQIPSGSDLVSDVYLNKLNGSPMNGATVQYSLVNSDSAKQLASGSASANSSGLATITIPSSKLISGSGMSLKVTTTDQYGNTILSQAFFSVSGASGEQWDTSGAGQLDLNVRGTSGKVKVGDTVNLTISSPAALRAMVTMDRGRIYNPSMLDLKQGSNSYSFTVTSDLAPSFTLTFSYFQNGMYHSEGVGFTVSVENQANVSIQGPNSVTAGTNTTLQLAATDSSGSSLPVTYLVDVVSAKTYGLSKQVTPDIFSSFYAARPIMTSSSSSLSPVGSGGGRCGGGAPDLPSFANAVGTTLDWRPEVQASNGTANVSLTPPKGSWTVTVYAVSDNTMVGSQTTTFTAN